MLRVRSVHSRRICKYPKEAKELGIAFEKVSFGNRESYFPKELLKIFMSITPQTPKEEVQKKIDMLTCPFLEKDAMGICSCKIYDKRPKVCRLFGSAIHPTLICPNNRSAKDD